MAQREYNFDGLVGPTHNYAGLSPGNLASEAHEGQVSSPLRAALEGLEKMRAVAALGVGQAVLPPQPRPSLRTLRALGFSGSDEEVLVRAAREAEPLVRLVSSAAAMWTANAATSAPSEDTLDGRMHLTPANLQAMFHREIEADTTTRVLRSIFADTTHFSVHAPLPGGGQFSDEGAANHTRLAVPSRPAVHLFAWGRSSYRPAPAPVRFPARQTLEASEALARLHQLAGAQCLFPQQAPAGIDAGAFHSDVLAVGNEGFLMLHAAAFTEPETLLARLAEKLGPGFRWALASEAELPLQEAVAAYPFNSQLVTLPSGKMAIVAPKEAEERPRSRAFLERVVAEDNPVEAVHYLEVRQSMNNGGGPACLRQRIRLTDAERAVVRPRVFYDEALHRELAAWVRRHYRERLSPDDLRDPALAREGMAALDALTQLLRLGSVYDFQQAWERSRNPPGPPP
jgi:succinylarginine dihydrolase